MSTAKDQSIGEELIRIIRAEIRAYDERKDEAVRLRAVADEAVAEADQAAKAARDSKPHTIGAAISATVGAAFGIGDTSAQAIDALFERQQKPLVDFPIGGRSIDRAVRQAETVAEGGNARDVLLRNQQQSAEKSTAWQLRGTNLPRRRWWQRPKG